jgi:hypothetical protein
MGLFVQGVTPLREIDRAVKSAPNGFSETRARERRKEIGVTQNTSRRRY